MLHHLIRIKGKLISVLTEYDEAQRPFKKEIDTGIKRISHHYKYYDEGSKIRQVPDMETLPDGTSIIYSYDRAGNIVHQVKTKNGVVGESVHYRYDVSGRLLSEKVYNGSTFSYCYEYQYDNNGNITFKIEYNSDGTIKSKSTYIYSTTVKDQLLRIESTVGTVTNPQSINYNANDPFRPSSYKDNTLSWEGRRLTRYGDTTYEYNSEGIRISKTVNNQTTSFILEGSRIIKEVKPNHDVYYHYDHEGMLTGFNYSGDEYFYIRSLTGNIEKVVDSNGNISVEYKYDAWGNVLSITGNAEIKGVNNFLYKGYYYDSETGLYYNVTRYYDPKIGRFISADDISYLDPESIGGLNLYAYCGNNPVMGYDPMGTWDWSNFWKITGSVLIIGAAVGISVLTFGAATPVLIGAAVGFGIGGGFELGRQLIAGDGIDMAAIGWAALGGAVSGAVSAIPIGNFASLGVGGKVLSYGLTALTGGSGAVLGGIVSGSVTDLRSGAIAFGIGGVANMLAKFATDKIGAHIQNKANKFLSNDFFGSTTLGDMVGHSSRIYNDLGKALMQANGQYFRSIAYMLTVSSVSSGLSGWY